MSEDLRRRDFTVNATAIALGGPQAGELIAVPGALDDLDARRLRILHERSFSDDPTRLLRLARYAGRLGFAIEPGTLMAARTAIRDGALSTVSGNRTGAELRLLAREEDPVAALVALHELELDRAFHPQFGLTEPAELDRALELLPADGRHDILALAAAAQRVPDLDLAALLDHLAFEAGDREAILRAATAVDETAAAVGQARAPSEIARALASVGPEGAALVGARGDGKAVRDWLERLRHVRLEIDGRDLLAAGVAEGPAVGRALRAALDAKLDGRAVGREAELAEALRAAG
jgi:tRNA nucleotidyltransferase (CCA-adding enzyme)